MSNQAGKDFQQTAGLIEDAFQLFDKSRDWPGTQPREAADRAHLMIQAAQAGAALMAIREQRAANLLAAAYAPENLQVDPTLTRAAYEEAVSLLGLVQEEPGPLERMTNEQLFDLLTRDDPADKDVTE